MKKFAVSAALFSSLAFAQNQVVPGQNPVPASGSAVQVVNANADQAVGNACVAYDSLYYNWQTGNLTTCAAGTWMQPFPLLSGNNTFLGNNTFSSLSTGTTANKDLAGSVTLASGTATYSFAGSYANAPVCVATDTTAVAAVRVAATNTQLTITGTGTDVINYHCIARN